MANILFDLDDTLAPEKWRETGIDEAFLYLHKKALEYGITVTWKHLEAAKDQIYDMIKDSGRRTDKRDRFRLMLDIAARDSGRMPRRLIDNHLEEAFRIYQNALCNANFYSGAESMLRRLGESGNSWWIFSNGTSEDVETKIQNLGLALLPGYQKTFSTDTLRSGVVLPMSMNKTVEAYQRLIGRCDIDVMVGDREKGDIIPAREAGLVTYHVTPENRSRVYKTIISDFC